MDIRQLRTLIALARERHFSRAAEACAVTQPTLSARIRQLEDDLGVQIVRRGQRYHGLTPEGERVLAWAKRIVEDFDGMKAELSLGAGALEGRVTLGVIPSALPVVPALATALRDRHPKLRLTVLSRSSAEIERALDDLAIDAGLTYVDGAPPARCLVRPLYVERYRLFVREDHPLADRDVVTWAEAAGHPLCALTPDMQNRRIVDAAFRTAGVAPEPEIESNSVVNLTAFVRAGGLAAVLTEQVRALIAADRRIRAIPLVEPVVEHDVGLLVLDRTPPPVLVSALLAAASGFRLEDPVIDGPDRAIESCDLPA